MNWSQKIVLQITKLFETLKERRKPGTQANEQRRHDERDLWFQIKKYLENFQEMFNVSQMKLKSSLKQLDS